MILNSHSLVELCANFRVSAAARRSILVGSPNNLAVPRGWRSFVMSHICFNSFQQRI